MFVTQNSSQHNHNKFLCSSNPKRSSPKDLEKKKISQTLKSECLLFEEVSRGFCNSVYKVQNNKENPVIVKLFSPLTKLRQTYKQQEAEFDRYLGDKGLAPRVISCTTDLLVTEYISGRTLLESDILESKKLRYKVSELLVSLHKIKCDSIPTPLIWVWLFKLIEELKVVENLPNFISVEDLEKAVKEMHQIFKDSKMSIGICHGDLKPSNMMISDENKLLLIDLDLSGPNYYGFDVMKIFRTSEYTTSVKKEEILKEFIKNYCELYAGNLSPKGKHIRKDTFLVNCDIPAMYAEAKMCEPLTWLEVKFPSRSNQIIEFVKAALFFSLSIALDGSGTKIFISLSIPKETREKQEMKSMDFLLIDGKITLKLDGWLRILELKVSIKSAILE